MNSITINLEPLPDFTEVMYPTIKVKVKRHRVDDGVEKTFRK